MSTRVDVAQLADGQVRTCSVDGIQVLVCRVRGELFAIADECSHARQALSAGRLRGYRVICPLHGAAFDVRDGRCLGPPATRPVQAFDVTLSDDGSQVLIEAR